MSEGSKPASVPDRLADFSPAQKFVYKELQAIEPATQPQIADETLLPARTVRDAIYTLCDEGEVEEIVRPTGDARKKWYATVSDGEHASDC